MLQPSPEGWSGVTPSCRQWYKGGVKVTRQFLKGK